MTSRPELLPGLAIEKHRLDNGLGVLMLADRSAPVVSYHTWYRVGSRHEEKGKTGLAHLFEHLMFNRTKHLAPGQFDRELEAVGGDTNAATWVDWTCYRDNVPSAHLELVVRLEAERMQHLVLDEAEVASEREVVANERRYRVEDDVEGFLGEELYRRAFTVHPYHHPTIGWMRDIESLTVEDARAFYLRFYTPANATLVLVGDFDPARALALIERAYGWCTAPPPPEMLAAVEPPQAALRRATFAKPVAADRLLLGCRAPAQGSPDWIASLVVQELLLAGPSARLRRRLVVDTEIAASACGSLAPFRDPGLLEVQVALVRGHRAAEAEAIVDEELDRLGHEPVLVEELERAKNRLETAHFAQLDTADGKAEALGHYESTLGDHLRLLAVPDQVRATSAEDVRDAARRYFGREQRTVVVAEPASGIAGGGEARELEEEL